MSSSAIVEVCLRPESTAQPDAVKAHINQLLALVEDSCHRIQKEQLVNAARAKVSGRTQLRYGFFLVYLVVFWYLLVCLRVFLYFLVHLIGFWYSVF